MEQITLTTHNLTCEHVLHRLPAYLDNEIAPPEHDAISAHLTQCESCRVENERLMTVWAELDQLGTSKTPTDLHGKIMQAMHNEETPPTRMRFIRLLPISAAVAVVGLLVGGWMARTILDTEAVRQGEHSLAAAMDVFAPNPRGTFVSGYLATLENPGRHP